MADLERALRQRDSTIRTLKEDLRECREALREVRRSLGHGDDCGLNTVGAVEPVCTCRYVTLVGVIDKALEG